MKKVISGIACLILCVGYTNLMSMTQAELEVANRNWENNGCRVIISPDLKIDLKQHPNFCFIPSLSARIIAFITLNTDSAEKVVLQNLIPSELWQQILVFEEAMREFNKSKDVYCFTSQNLGKLNAYKFALQAFLSQLPDRKMQESLITKLLFNAAYYDGKASLEHLHSLGANLNCVESSNVILDAAAYRNSIGVMSYLCTLKTGFVTRLQIARAKNRQGRSRLGKKERNAEAAELLSQAIICPKLERKNKKLLAAAGFGDIEAIKKLLIKGAEINALDEQNNTPLMLAAQNGQLEVVKFLIANRAIRHLVNLDNLSAEQLAHQAGHNEIMEILGLLRYWGENI